MKDRIRSGYFLIWTLYLIITQPLLSSYLSRLTSEAFVHYTRVFSLAAICVMLLVDFCYYHLRNSTPERKYDIRIIGANGLGYIGERNPENVMLYGLVSLLFMVLTGNDFFLILLPFFILGGKYLSKDWIKPIFFVLGLELVIQTGMVCIGYAEDRVISMYYGDFHSLGYGNPNALGRVFLFLFLTGWYLYIDNKAISYVIGILTSVSVFLITGCRTASLVILLLPLLFTLINSKLWKRNKRWTDHIVRFFPLLCAGVSFITGFILVPFDGQIDSNFICRFVELPYGLRDFGLSLFPRELTTPDRVYYFDNYYIWLLISCGILLFLAFMGLNTRVSYMVARLGDSKVAVLVICVMLYQIMEKSTFNMTPYYLYYFLFVNYLYLFFYYKNIYYLNNLKFG